MRATSLALIVLLAGCVGTTPPGGAPAVATISANPEIVAAQATLERAQLQLAEWTVIETTIAEYPLPLSTLLKVAREKQRSGDYFEASRLAKKVSRFARLGLQQALQQANARPYYPQ